MILKALEIQGFKSFPDKTKLVFDRGLTAVVGPNGSGKSNVSDAVRWVLGDQSTKTLRASKMTDVIFSGTDQRTAKGFAQVKIFLEDEDNSLKLNKKEVCISRTYYRSGESEYQINDKKVKLRDIYELFFDTGIGKNGYSIVSQGKIENLVSSAGKDRREIFDEAVGISQLRFKKIEAVRKIEAAEENLIRLKDIYAEIKDRYLPLKRQKEKAEAYLVYANDLRKLDVSLRLTLLSEIESKVKEIEHKLDINEVEYENINKNLAETERQIEEQTDENQETAMAVEALKNAIVKMNEEKSSLNSQFAVTDNNIENSMRDVQRIENEIDFSGGSKEEVQSRVDELSCKVDELVTEKEKLEKEHSDTSKELESLNDLMQEETNKTMGIQNLIDINTSKLSQLNLENSANEILINELNEDLKQADLKIKEQNEAKTSLIKDLQSEEKAFEESQKNLKSVTNILSGYEMRKNKQTEKVENTREKIEQLKENIFKLKNELAMQITYQNNLGGWSKSAVSFSKAVKSGMLAGIEGSLSENIKTKSEYSLAIETALGAAIQNFITDSNISAKKAVKFLKDKNMGRLTFLPVDTIKARQLNESGITSNDGVIDIASNLVESKDRHRQIVEFLLGRVVVVDTIDNGFKLAKKYKNRFRIVTLDGQIIGVGGSVTGGSKVKTSGLLSIKDKIAKLQSNFEKEEEKLSQIAGEYKEQLSALAKINADFDGANGDMQRINQAFLVGEERLRSLKERISEREKALEILNSDKAFVIERLEKNKNISEEIKIKIKDLNEKNEELKKSLSQVSEEKTDSKSENLSERLIQFEKEIIAFEKEIENKKYILDGLNSSMRDSDEKISRLNEEKESILSQINLYREEKEKINEKISEIDKKIISDNEKIEEILKKSSDFEKAITNLRNLEKIQMEDREKTTGELSRLREKLANERENYEETNRKLYEEYSLTIAGAREEAEKTDNISQTRLQIGLLKEKIRKLGNINVGAIEEFKELDERYKEYTKQIEDIEKAKAKLLKLSRELTNTMTKRFKTEFEKINKAFQTVFVEMFSGGKASLEIENDEDILESNINISVQPPGKNVQNISLLSGGEKGIAAICLLFAILKVNPSPFCIFDEVEAALDDVNVAKFAAYVRKMTDKTQFILITHRRGTMEEADRLYGVTMQEEGVSKLLLMDLKEIESKMKI
ncbi:MAG: chromosome segregation protein SMC [Clostridia bacterium]|nr:chromosome segregation protein SMC [Clostridia bacterium]